MLLSGIFSSDFGGAGLGAIEMGPAMWVSDSLIFNDISNSLSQQMFFQAADGIMNSGAPFEERLQELGNLAGTPPVPEAIDSGVIFTVPLPDQSVNYCYVIQGPEITSTLCLPVEEYNDQIML